MDIKFFEKYRNYFSPSARRYYDNKLGSSESNYLDAKRSEVDTLNRNFEERNLPTTRFNWGNVPGTMLQAGLGTFTTIPRSIAAGISMAKGEDPYGVKSAKSFSEAMKSGWKFGTDLQLNRGAFSNQGLAQVTRKYGGDFWKKEIDWMDPYGLGKKLAEAITGNKPPSNNIYKMVRDSAQEGFRDWAYNDEKNYGRPTGVEGLDDFNNFMRNLPAKIMKNKWGYATPLGIIKGVDALETFLHESTNDPAALVGLASEIALDPFTYIGAPGALKALTTAGKVVVEQGTKGVAKLAAKELAEAGGKLIGKEILEKGGIRLGAKTAAEIVEEALLLSGMKNPKFMVKGISEGNEFMLKHYLNKIDDLAEGAIRSSKAITEPADVIIKRYGRSFAEGSPGINGEGLKKLSTMKEQLRKTNIWNSPETATAVEKAFNLAHGVSDQLPLGEYGNLAMKAKALLEFKTQWVAKESAKIIEPIFYREAIASGLSDKIFSRGGLELMVPFTHIRKTVFPYSKWEQMGIPKFGGDVLKWTAKNVPGLQLGINKLKMLYRPARLASQDLHDIFLTQMQLVPDYKLHQMYKEFEVLREEYGLPPLQNLREEEVLTYGISYLKQNQELVRLLDGNPAAKEAMERLVRKYSDSVKSVADRMAYLKNTKNLTNEEQRNVVTGLIDYFAAENHNYYLSKGLKQNLKNIPTTPAPLPPNATLYDAAQRNLKMINNHKIIRANLSLIETTNPNLWEELVKATGMLDADPMAYYILADRTGIDFILDRNMLRKSANITGLKDVIGEYGIDAVPTLRFTGKNNRVGDRSSFTIDVSIQDSPVPTVRPQQLSNRLAINTVQTPERLTSVDAILKGSPNLRSSKDNITLSQSRHTSKELAAYSKEMLEQYEKLGDAFQIGAFKKGGTTYLAANESLYGSGANGMYHRRTGVDYNILENSGTTLRTPEENIIKVLFKGRGRTEAKHTTAHEIGHLIQETVFDEDFPKEWVLQGLTHGTPLERMYSEATNQALLVKVGVRSEAEAIRYIKGHIVNNPNYNNFYFLNSVHRDSGSLDDIVKKIYDDSLTFVNDQVTSQNAKRVLNNNEVILRLQKRVNAININADLEFDKLFTDMVTPGNPLSLRDRDLDTLSNEEWPELFRYRDEIVGPNGTVIQQGMTSAERQKVAKLRDYAKDWMALPDNKKQYAYALNEKLKDILDYENIMGVGTTNRPGLYGDYVPGMNKVTTDRGGEIKVGKFKIPVGKLGLPPGFKERKSFENPIARILAHPEDASHIELSLTNLVMGRDTASIKAAATTDFLRYTRAFGRTTKEIEKARKEYYAVSKKLQSQGLEPKVADEMARQLTIDKYEFDFTKFTESLDAKDDIYGILGSKKTVSTFDDLANIRTDTEKFVPDYMFTVESADYLKASSQFFTDKNIGAILRTMQTFNKWWKTFATVVVPGFHSRNAQSNLFNMFLASGPGVLSPTLHKQMIRAMSGEVFDIYHPILKRNITSTELLELAGEKGIFDLGLVGEDIMARESRIASNKAVKGWREKAKTIYNPASVEGPLAKYGAKLGQAVENEARLTLFTHDFLKYGDADFAASRVQEFLFNYRDITQFDSNIMKTFIPFWVWSKKNIPLQYRNLVRQPRKFGTFVHLKDYMRRISEDPETNKVEGYEFEPDYIKELMGVVTPFMTPSGTRMVYNPNFAFQDLTRVTPKDWLAGITPLLKVPLELIANKEMFTGAPIKPEGSSGLKEAPAYMDWLNSLKLPIPGTYDGVGYEGEPITMVDPYLDYALKQIPLVGNIGKAMPQSERLKEKSPLKLLSMLAGVKFFEYSPETSEYWALKDKIAQLEELKDYYRKQGLWEE